MSEKQRKILLIGTGRCGSSLLSAILSDAGANFGMPSRDKWDRSSGAYEHPMLLEAVKWYVRSQRIANSIIPSRVRDFCQRRAALVLRHLFEQATYAKSPMLVHMFHILNRLPYDYRIILIFRQFEEYAVSRHIKNGWDIEKLVHEYLNVNQTALLELHYLGGCAVSYEDLVDPTEAEWSSVLGGVCGIPAHRILACREMRLADTRPMIKTFALDHRPTELYGRLQKITRQVVCPHNRP